MLEFHGWAAIEVEDSDDADLAVLDGRRDEAHARLSDAISHIGDHNCIVELRRTGNDLVVLMAHGLKNHSSQIVDLFQWIADNLPYAYGLLYVWNDEDDTLGRGDFTNCFRVWRLARGVLSEHADPFLSPRIPVVEPPFDFNGGA